MSENVEAGLWAGDMGWAAAQGNVGIVWEGNPYVQAKINSSQKQDGSPVAPQNGINRAMDNSLWARPSSAHSGVAVVTFADGHTTLLNEEIDQQVYAALLTPDGKNSNIPGPGGGTTPPFQLDPISETDLAN